MDIVNWLYLKKAELIRSSISSPDDLVLLGTDVGFEKRGDKYLTYAVPVSLLMGGGGGITLKTNGTNNSSQTVLNIQEGSNITISESFGTVTINSTAGTTYDANAGIYKDTSLTNDTFQLGTTLAIDSLNIPFTTNRYINLNRNSFNILGSINSSDVSNLFTIDNAGFVNIAMGDIDESNGGTKITINDTSGGSQGPGGIIELKANTKTALYLDFGAGEYYFGDKSFHASGSFVLYDLPSGDFFFKGNNAYNNPTNVNLTIQASDGMIAFNKYGVGNFAATPAYYLGVDSTGQITETFPNPLTIVKTAQEDFTIDGTYYTVAELNFKAVFTKSYHFRAVIHYKVLDRTDQGTGWTISITGAGFENTGWYSQLWRPGNSIWTIANLYDLYPEPTPTVSSNDNSYNIAIVEGILTNCKGTTNVYVRGAGKTGSGTTVFNGLTILPGSSLTIIRTP